MAKPAAPQCRAELLFLLFIAAVSAASPPVPASALVPAMYVFGDSLIDDGNNNDMQTLAKANYPPYGIDFAGGIPTGRFCNGYTMVDEIAELLGLPLLPPNAAAAGGDILHGVNYASAAAGILDITGENYVGRIPLNQQIKNFEATLANISAKVGSGAATVSRSLFYVAMGSNDYLNNYLLPGSNLSTIYSGEQFADMLIEHYTRQLRSLYDLGARKFIVAGIGSMGCIPHMRVQSRDNRCLADVDELVAIFNGKVKEMIAGFNATLPRATFVYIDTFAMISDILARPASYRFTVVERACCGVGRDRGELTCLPMQTPCPDREQFVFWDAFHPTAKVNVALARAAFYGAGKAASPMSIQDLARLDLH